LIILIAHIHRMMDGSWQSAVGFTIVLQIVMNTKDKGAHSSKEEHTQSSDCRLPTCHPSPAS